MSDDLLNILSNSNKDIDNQKLMDYISGKLSAADRHDFERALVDSEMMNDAVEGLEKLKNKKSSKKVSGKKENKSLFKKKLVDKKKSSKTIINSKKKKSSKRKSKK